MHNRIKTPVSANTKTLTGVLFTLNRLFLDLPDLF